MKNKTPNNKVGEAVREWEDAEGLVREVNRLAEECRAMAFGFNREQCYLTLMFPLLEQLNQLDYSVEWDVEATRYKLVPGGSKWVHPTIKLS